MDSDDYQQAWKSQSAQTRVTIDTDSLLNLLRHNQQAMRAAISWNDFGAIGIELLLLPVWIYLGVSLDSPWTWYLMVPVLIWSAGFKLVVRARRKKAPNDPSEPLLSGVKESLALVEHQIWLQRNIFWWSELPMAIAMLVFFVHVSWQGAVETNDWLSGLGAATFFSVLVLAVFSFIYYINRRIVRTQHEPRRQELLSLLTSLQDETTGAVTGEYPMLTSGKGVICSPSPRRMVVAGLWVAAILLIGVPGILYVTYRLDQYLNQEYPKKSPFAAVRWQQAQPEVKVGDEWFKLVSLDDLPASEIVAFSQQTYGDLWQKRFEEDLVELLTRMGHPPDDTVTLVVQSLTSSETRTLDDVPMTTANRQAIRDAAEARELGAQQQAMGTAGPIDGTPVSLTDQIPDLRKEKKLVGLAAMVMVDGQVVASAVDGERKNGSNVPLEIGDRWHLGSITKSVTATMIARLVESGQIEWSYSIGECFSDASIHDDWKPVTLHQLVTHTAGAPANFSVGVRLKQPALGPECTQARLESVLAVLAKQPAHVPGKEHAYSNVGFTIAGAMAEKATGESWEDLVKREVFEPLELTGAGFGPPKSSDQTLEQPRGHSSYFGWTVAADDKADNTPIMGPAGTVHMTLKDLCTYATEHLRGELGAGRLLSAETYTLLHTPVLDDYACGWVKNEPNAFIPHTVYWHNGSNTMWYALVVFIPDKNMVVAVTSNDGDIEHAEAAAWEVVTASAN
jgi:CubicO group peptidase (beta-lactamase class C family)